MSVTYSGTALVRLSIFVQHGDQTGIMDRTVSALNPLPGVLWNSADYMTALDVTGIIPFLQPLFTTDTDLLGLKTYAQVPGSPSLIDKHAFGAFTGTQAPPILPSQVSGLISWTSSISGKRGGGRDYVPFVPASGTTTDGLPNAGYKTHLSDFATFLRAAIVIPNVGVGGGTCSIRLCTKYTVGTPPLAFPMSSFSVGEGFATQRRRGYYGRRNVAPIF